MKWLKTQVHAYSLESTDKTGFLVNAAFLGGHTDGDAFSPAPDWVSEPGQGTPENLKEYASELTIDRGLSENAADALVYAYTNYTGDQRNADWSIRTKGAYMSTDWRYGAAIKHKMAIRTEANPNAKNYFYNFNHTNHWYYGNDLNYHLKLFWMTHSEWVIKHDSYQSSWIK